MGAPERRTCFVVDVLTGDVDSGQTRRIAGILERLTRMGAVDLVVARPGPDDDLAVWEDRLGVRLLESEAVGAQSKRTMAMGQALLRRRPLALATAPRLRASGAADVYDLVWWNGPRAFVEVPSIRGRRRVVDVGDLEDVKLRRAGRPVVRKHVHGAIQHLLWRYEILAWRRFYRHLLGTVDQAFLAGLPLGEAAADVRFEILPNCYDDVDPLPERPPVPGPPRLLFAGLMSYQPNVDALRHLVRDILPRLREHWPDITVDVVGRWPGEVIPPEFAGVEGLQIRGFVPSMPAALEAADIVVVPVRVASGTRVKIIEAMAYGRPVVTTSIGAEGLGLRDGVDVVVADNPTEFAAAVVRLAHDADLRGRLVVQARQTYEERFRWESIDPLLHALFEP